MPGPIYHDACKVRIQVRFEEYDSDAPQVALPSQPAIRRVPAGSEAFGLGIVQDTERRGGFKNIGFDIIPSSCVVERNSYRKADEARCTFPAQRLPLDPKTIRAMTIQIYGGVYSARSYAEVLTRAEPTQLILPDKIPFDDNKKANEQPEAGVSNELFRGSVDEIKLSLGRGDMVELRARDLTQEFIDTPIPPNALRDIPKNAPLDEVIRLLIRGDGKPPDGTRRLGVIGVKEVRVVNEVIDEATDRIRTLPSFRQFRPPTYFDSKGTVKKGGKQPKKQPRLNFWDLITDICITAGLLVHVRAVENEDDVSAEVVITNARTYYGETLGRNGVKFIQERQVRHFLYGINILKLETSRRLKGIVVPTIELRSWDPVEGVQNIARFPQRKKNNNPSVSGKADRETIRTIPVANLSGPDAKAILREYAESVYEQLARPEMKVKVRTRQLSGFLSNFNDGDVADLFQLRTKDPIFVDVERAQIEEGNVNRNTFLAQMTQREKIQDMKVNGIDGNIAAAIVEPQVSQFVQREFRTQTVVYNFQGTWDISIDAINYLDVRNGRRFRT